MHGSINVKSPNNTSKWQMGLNSAFKGLTSSYILFLVLSSLLSTSPSILSIRTQFLRNVWPIHLAFLLLIVRRTFLSSLILCHIYCLHNMSNWSSQSFSINTPENVHGICDVLSEVSNIYHHTKLCSKCIILLVYSLNLSRICERNLLLVEYCYFPPEF
jgi:hypothetical protein